MIRPYGLVAEDGTKYDPTPLPEASPAAPADVPPFGRGTYIAASTRAVAGIAGQSIGSGGGSPSIQRHSRRIVSTWSVP